MNSAEGRDICGLLCFAKTLIRSCSFLFCNSGDYGGLFLIRHPRSEMKSKRLHDSEYEGYDYLLLIEMVVVSARVFVIVEESLE